MVTDGNIGYDATYIYYGNKGDSVSPIIIPNYTIPLGRTIKGVETTKRTDPITVDWSEASNIENIIREFYGITDFKTLRFTNNVSKKMLLARDITNDRILKIIGGNNLMELANHYEIDRRDVDNIFSPRLFYDGPSRINLPAGISTLYMEDLGKHGNFCQNDNLRHESLSKASACLDWLHSQGYSHGDVKSENFMGNGEEVRMIDFETMSSNDRCIGFTVSWSSPQVLRLYGLSYKQTIEGLSDDEVKELLQINDSFDGKANDVYSFGVLVQKVLYDNPELLTSRHVRDTEDTYRRLLSISENPHNVYVPVSEPRLKSLVESMLDLNPLNRPKMGEVYTNLNDIIGK